MEAWNGEPTLSGSTVTCAPHGTAAFRCAVSASWAARASVPGGTRRLTRARAVAGTAAAEPTTGGQSMPSTVTAGLAQSRSATVPEPVSRTPSRTPASVRNCCSS